MNPARDQADSQCLLFFSTATGVRDPLQVALRGWPDISQTEEWTTHSDPLRTVAKFDVHARTDANAGTIRIEVIHESLAEDTLADLMSFEMSAACRAALHGHQSLCRIDVEAGIGFAIVRLLVRFIVAAFELPLTLVVFPAGRIAWSRDEFKNCSIEKPTVDITDWLVTHSMLTDANTSASSPESGRAVHRSWGMSLFKLPDILCTGPPPRANSDDARNEREAIQVLFDSLPPYLLRLGAAIPLDDVVELGRFDWRVTKLPSSLAIHHSPFGLLHLERSRID